MIKLIEFRTQFSEAFSSLLKLKWNYCNKSQGKNHAARLCNSPTPYGDVLCISQPMLNADSSNAMLVQRRYSMSGGCHVCLVFTLQNENLHTYKSEVNTKCNKFYAQNTLNYWR
jgi:hypothetical protein